MSQESDPWVAVGIVLRPHALGGALFVKPLTRDADEFIDAPLERVTLRRRGEILGTYRIRTRVIHGGAPLLTFEGVTDRTGAEALQGAEILIPEEERWELGEGRYYLDELSGIDLIDDETGEPVARTLRAMEGAAHDFLVFPHPAGEGKEVLLPLIPQFVPSIDVKNRTARVRIPEGLLEL